jgi:hypothetical protein
LADGQASFLLTADSRYTAADATADMAIKTYSLGPRTGAVAAGSALSVGSAAELTRGIAEDHNRLKPNAPINFYSTVRLFSFFLDQAENANPLSTGSEVALAGFFSNGKPSPRQSCNQAVSEDGGALLRPQAARIFDYYGR